jgi:hypothetical protein
MTEADHAHSAGGASRDARTMKEIQGKENKER